MADNPCIRCGEPAVGRLAFQFPDGEVEYNYCQPCAETVNHRYRVDRVVAGDLQLPEPDPE